MNELNDNRIQMARNRVFDTSNNIPLGKNNSTAMSTKTTSIYRMTGKNQLDDIILSGYVRPKEGHIKGGHKNEVFWSRGSDKLFYYNGGIVLEVSSDKLIDNQIGAIPFKNLIGIWCFNEMTMKYENRIEFYKKIYDELHQDNEITNTIITKKSK